MMRTIAIWVTMFFCKLGYVDMNIEVQYNEFCEELMFSKCS